MEILNARNNSSPVISSKNTASPQPKKRRQFSDSQKNFLIQFYDNTEHYPTPEEYALFAVRFNISKFRVKTWFHNRRSRLRPSKRASEPWDFPIAREYSSRSTTTIWNFLESVAKEEDLQVTNEVLFQNPRTFQASHQQLPTFQGEGFIPSDLYEAQAWLKKKREWENHWKKIAEL